MATTPVWYNDSITPNQRRAIRLIEKFIGVNFNGYNKGQAMSFIGTHYDKAKLLRDKSEKNVQRITNKTMANLVLEKTGPWE